jgi:5-methylcytosine-specific restriction protein A
LIKSIKTIHRNQSNVSIPITTTKEVKSYVRDFKVSILCKQNANGKCACCKKIIGKDMLLNIPELQCHHIVPLCNGGSDSIENCEALCPNCHR